MKRILLPTDFSENSRNAMEYAFQFFKGHECHFVLLNVQKPSEFLLDDFYTASAAATINETLLKDNKTTLEKLTLKYRETYASEAFTFDPIVDYDALADSINQVIQSENIDLIIMGSNGATGASEVIFGSNTLKVIRKVHYPVLIIPEGYTYQKLDTLLFSAHNHEFHPESLQLLKELIRLKEPKVTLLNVEETVQELNTQNHRATVESHLDQKVDAFYTLEGVPLATAIHVFVQLHTVQLHAMFMERESFLKRFLVGSTASEISYKSRVPLLVMHS